jgi:signal transduction histidine kinase
MHTPDLNSRHAQARAFCLWSMLAWILMLLASSARAQVPGPDVPAAPTAQVDLITAREFFRDPGGQLSLAQVQAQAFKPFRGPLALGNTAAVTWLKLTLAPSSGTDWLLLIQPALLQDVQVHEPLPGGGWRVQRLGNQWAHAQRAVKSLPFSVPVVADAQQPITLYVRVQTPSSAVHVRVVPEPDVRELDGRLHGLVGVYAGIGLTMMVLSLAGWAVTRQRVWLLSALIDAATLALTAIQLGFVAKYLLPGAEGVLHHALVIANCTHMALISLFLWQLYRQFKAPRWVVAPYLVAVCAWPVMLLLQARGQPASALGLNNLIILVLSLWGFVVPWFLRPADRLTRVLVRVMALTLALYLLYWVSPLVLKLSPPTALSLYPTLPSNLFTMVMTVLVLARDAQSRTRAARQFLEDKRVADQQLQLERRMHEETAGFLGMLVHEVRNPLALIQVVARNIASGRTAPGSAQTAGLARIDHAVQDITDVLQRCVETDQLERGALAPQPAPVDAAACLRDWLALQRERERIQADLPAALPATLDAALWLAMVRNLVDNALKYAPAGAPIQLALQAEAGQLLVTVCNPPGPAGRPDATRLFSKYYRSDQAAGISGTGLGLYWVQRLSARLGGAVQVLPPGTDAPADAPVVFQLRLPLTPVTQGN